MSIDSERIKRWLVKVGRERAIIERATVLLRGIIPFEQLLAVGLQYGGVGWDFAEAKVLELKSRARRAGKTTFEYLKTLKEEGELRRLREELVLWEAHIEIIEQLIDLCKKYGIDTSMPPDIDPDKLYEDLEHMRYIGGDLLRHYIIYELVRVFGMRPPRNLRLPRTILEKLRVFGITEDMIRPEEAPYIDSAIWNL